MRPARIASVGPSARAAVDAAVMSEKAMAAKRLKRRKKGKARLTLH